MNAHHVIEDLETEDQDIPRLSVVPSSILDCETQLVIKVSFRGAILTLDPFPNADIPCYSPDISAFTGLSVDAAEMESLLSNVGESVGNQSPTYRESSEQQLRQQKGLVIRLNVNNDGFCLSHRILRICK